MQDMKQKSTNTLKWTRRVWLTDKVHSVSLLLPKKDGLDLIGLGAGSPYSIALGADLNHVDETAMKRNRQTTSLLPGTPI